MRQWKPGDGNLNPWLDYDGEEARYSSADRLYRQVSQKGLERETPAPARGDRHVIEEYFDNKTDAIRRIRSYIDSRTGDPFLNEWASEVEVRYDRRRRQYVITVTYDHPGREQDGGY